MKKATRKKAATTATRKKRSPARKKKSAVQAGPVAVESDVIAALMGDLRAKFGSEAAGSISESWRSMIGVPLPAFCLEYLFDLTALPLGKLIGLRGLPKTKKSGLSFEIYRWFRTACGGLGTLIEHESKFNSEWAASIIGYDDIDTLGYVEASSVDEWQKYLQEVTRLMWAKMVGTKTKPGLGTHFPFLVIVDSILGKSTEETQAKLIKQGSMTRNFPAEALSIKNFLQAFPQQIVRKPFSVVLINHLKPKQNDQGFVVDSSPGGYAVAFQLSFDIKVSKGGRDIHLAKVDGSQLMLEMVYSSYGQDHRKIPVDCVWTTVDETNPMSGAPYRQQTVWNWHRGTIKLLLETLDKDSRAKEACKLIGLQRATGKRAYAPKLGVPKTAPISYDEMGLKTFRNRKVMAAWRRIFGIKRSKVFQPGVPFEEQLKQAMEDHAAETYRETGDG